MSTTLLLKNGRILLPDREASGAVLIAEDRIEAVVVDDGVLPTADRTIDLGGAFVAPGFVDLHIHGAVGVDVMEATDAELARLAGWLATCGVTRFVPTTIAAPVETLGEVTERLASWIARVMMEPTQGAIPVGIHFEGPFLNKSRCGALDRERFLDGTERKAFFDAVGSERLAGIPVRLITVAPEIEGGIDLIRELVDRDFVVSIGHTQASLEVLDAAVEAGARHMTHFMNAMPQLHHRDPGPVGWGLLQKRVSADVIADFQHLHPDALRLIVGMKTSTRVALISDAIPPAGLGDGSFTVWNEPVIVEGLRTSNGTGTITGSVISLRDAVRNMISTGVPLVESIRMASTVPARVLGLEALGAIAPGKIADLVVFRDEVEPVLTIVAGRIVSNWEFS